MKPAPKMTQAVPISILLLMSWCSGLGAPNREQFIQECLNSAPSPETPKFDDYTEGSYHIDKLDLVNGLEEVFKSRAAPLRGVVIFGPSGPLWAYYVLVAFSDGEVTRLNFLVMPHARITAKGTATLSHSEYEQFMKKFVESKILTKGDPSSIKADDSFSRDFAYDILVAKWSDDRRLLSFASLEKIGRESSSRSKEAEALLDHLNTVLKRIEPTYPPKAEAPRRSDKK